MDKIEEFLRDSSCEPNSIRNVRSRLNIFFRAIDRDPNHYIPEDFRRLDTNKKLDIMDSIEKDVRTFAQTMENRPQKTQGSYLSAVKKFLEYNYVDLPKRFWNGIKNRNKLKRPRPSVEKRTPTPQELELILHHGNIRDKAFFLLKATSGMRLNEGASLRMADIDIDERIIRIRGEDSKGGYNRYTSFTTEAQKYLNLWLKERENWVKRGYKKSEPARKHLKALGYELVRKEHTSNGRTCSVWQVYKNGKEVSLDEVIAQDDRLFPYDTQTMWESWVTLLKRSGFDKKDTSQNLKYARYVYNPRCLRRYFKTYLRSAGMRKDFIDAMIAHETGVDKTYTDYSVFEKTIRKEYDKYNKALNVFTDYEEVRKEIKPEMDAMKVSVSSLITSNQKLEQELEEQKKKEKKRINDLEYQIHKMQEEEYWSRQLDNQEFIQQEIQKQIKKLIAMGIEIPK